MSIVKSLAVGNGDMFYIRHNSYNFTVIDCCLPSDRKDEILSEISKQGNGKSIPWFISTHPDQDHISGLVSFDDFFRIENFCVVKNKTTKSEETEDFKRYKKLHDDSTKAFYLKRECEIRLGNISYKRLASSGLKILWPILTNTHFRDALKEAENGNSPNNISPIIQYNVANSASMMWMGDLETDFMEKIKYDITPDPSNILFAPHHGRKSGRVPERWLKKISPTIIVVGEAPSSDLTYYNQWNTITQNSAGDIVFECLPRKTHIFVSKSTYSVNFLTKEIGEGNRHGCHYIGTFYT